MCRYMGVIPNTVSSVMTISRLHRFYGCTFLSQSITSTPCPLHFPHTNRPATPAGVVARGPAPPAFPESWFPHVQTARPSGYSLSPECLPHDSPGPQISPFPTPRQPPFPPHAAFSDTPSRPSP